MNKERSVITLRLIDARDLADLRNSSMGAAYQCLHKIKISLKKKKHQYVTNQEAAHYFGLTLEDFEAIIQNS